MTFEDERDMQKTLVAVLRLPLRDFGNAELAAFNLAVTGFGRVDEVNLSYEKALNADLIQPDGSVPAIEELKSALAHEINQRVTAGTWK